MFYKTNGFKLCIALLIGVVVFFLPRPEGTKFKITGDIDQRIMASVADYFTLVPDGKMGDKADQTYIL